MRNSGAEQLLLGDRALLRGPDVQELPRVVPLVDRVGHVEALVALETDQPCPEDLGERLRGLRLADPCLALEQEGFLEREREEERGREPAVGKVARPFEGDLELVDGREAHSLSLGRRRGPGVRRGSTGRLYTAT